MSFPDFQNRSAVAISQVMAGYDERAIQARIADAVLGITVASTTSRRHEARLMADLTVRLAARLYPTIAIAGPRRLREELVSLAARINPAISFAEEGDATHGIVIGPGATDTHGSLIFLGSAGSVATVSTRSPQDVGQTSNPFGPGVAACLGQALLFRQIFLREGFDAQDLRLNTSLSTTQRVRPSKLDSLVLVGAGAVGSAAGWALSSLREPPVVTVVDPEDVDLGNLQRYVLAERSDVGRRKVDLVRRQFPAAVTHYGDWGSFVQQFGYRHSLVGISVDSAKARLEVQTSLPQRVVNAWTQPGDLGVSAHAEFGRGACVACMYLPVGPMLNEDAVYAQALGVMDQLMSVRVLLHTGDPVPDPLLDLIAQRLAVDSTIMEPFRGRGIRDLYTEGICAGTVLPLGTTGTPRPDVHVPLAHQSALAGVLLAARLLDDRPASHTIVSRLNVLRSIDPEFINQRMTQDVRGICFCQDRDFLDAYHGKYRGHRQGAG